MVTDGPHGLEISGSTSGYSVETGDKHSQWWVNSRRRTAGDPSDAQHPANVTGITRKSKLSGMYSTLLALHLSNGSYLSLLD